jgi:hypothetical protein
MCQRCCLGGAAVSISGFPSVVSVTKHGKLSVTKPASLAPARSPVADQRTGGAMKYMLMICGDESMQLTDDQEAAVQRSTDAWVAEMEGRGIRLQGNRLSNVSDATTVRVRDGEVLVSDGPFAETKEQIGGFDLIECKDLDEAIEVASKHPVATFGTIEVRPFWTE